MSLWRALLPDNTVYAGNTSRKLVLLSGRFTSTIKTSLATGDGGVEGIDSDGTAGGRNTPWCSNNTNKIFYSSGQFSSTIKSSLGSLNDPVGLSADDANISWNRRGTTFKLNLQSGKISSTIKTSQSISSFVSDEGGCTYTGANTLFTNSANGKVFLMSGQFSSTLKTSAGIGAVDISTDGQHTLICSGANLRFISGQFTTTVLTSFATSDTNVKGIGVNDYQSRTGNKARFLGGDVVVVTPGASAMVTNGAAAAAAVVVNTGAVETTAVGNAGTITPSTLDTVVIRSSIAAAGRGVTSNKPRS